MLMQQKIIKKVLKETKKKKDQLLIEQNLVRSRIMMIVESEDNIKNFNRLPEAKKRKIALALFEEINYLSEQQILNEGFLMDMLKGIFGNAFGGLVQTLVEPMLNSILGGLGIDGYFKFVLISFFTKNPMKLAEGLKDCKVMTTLISQSLTEGLVMMFQKEQNISGDFANFLRNALAGAVSETAFVKKIEEFLGDIVCNGMAKLTENAKDVYNKLKGTNLAPGSAVA